MKERGILFSAPMVRALLDGSKTQTRRAMKTQPASEPFVSRASLNQSGTRPVTVAMWDNRAPDGSTCCICPYGVVGDRLWVRETWCAHSTFNGIKPSLIPQSKVFYASDDGYSPSGAPGRPSIFMPRWASRITLEITDVRVERLQDISEADAITEGIEFNAALDPSGPCKWRYYKRPSAGIDCPVGSYESLWDSINGAGSWDANPWVWVVSFAVTP